MNKLITGSAEILTELLLDITEKRTRQKMSTESLAEVTGIDLDRLNKIEKLQELPTMQEYSKILYVLDTPPESNQPKIPIGDNFVYCPNCDYDILYKVSGLELDKDKVSKLQAYCNVCGIKLDWSFI